MWRRNVDVVVVKSLMDVRLENARRRFNDT